MSKQRSTLLPKTATMLNEFCVEIASFRQSRTLLRHCCPKRQHCRSNFDNVASTWLLVWAGLKTGVEFSPLPLYRMTQQCVNFTLLRHRREQLRSIVMSTSVCACMCVCLSVREDISGTKRAIFKQFSDKFMAVAQSSSGVVAIRYVLPVLLMTSVTSLFFL